MLFGALAILQAVMFLLLVAVCGNTATLILARASERSREVGIRLAAGAGRARIVRLILTENIILAVLGSMLGVAIAWWGTDALRAVPLPGGLPIRMQTQVDLVTLAFAVLLGVACGVVCGAAPALQLSGVDPSRALRAGARLCGAQLPAQRVDGRAGRARAHRARRRRAVPAELRPDGQRRSPASGRKACCSAPMI